jgi:hypothetical protein
MTKKKKQKCYIYIRVSTEMQVEGYSLDAQKDKLIRYADYQNMEVVREYCDAGKSGKSIAGRPEFSQMLQMEHVIALDKAVELGGLDFAGRAHDGLSDARNTADLFKQTSDQGSKEFARLRRSLIESKKSCTFSLGEVFNFGTLNLAQ